MGRKHVATCFLLYLKAMKTLSIILFASFLLFACSTSKLIEQWNSTDNLSFEANKVLVIGMTEREDSRRIFEKRLVSELENNGVIAVKSIDFFEQSFIASKKSEEELNNIENQLLKAGFDAILLSKVISSENKLTLIQAFKNMNRSFYNFKEDYYQNQEIFFTEDYYEKSKIFHTETSLYCICPEKERELLWRGSIDLINPIKTEKAVRDYVKLLIKELKRQDLLIIQN